MEIKRVKKSAAQIFKTVKGEVLVSYETPVAARLFTPEGTIYYKTAEHFSVTTSKHINQFIHKDLPYEIKPQSFFDALLTISINS